MSALIRPRRLFGEAFRGYADPFEVSFPESGVTLIQGTNRDTGDTSDSGKSTLLIALAHVFGGCPYPATRLQSWHTKKAFTVGADIDTPSGSFTVVRHKTKGLSITKLGDEEVLARGAAADELLDKIFGGMSAELRAAATYCRQGSPGLYLSLSDEQKKAMLAALVPELNRYETVAKDAGEAMADLQAEVDAALQVVATASGAESACAAALQQAEAAVGSDPTAEVETAAAELASVERRLAVARAAAQVDDETFRAAGESYTDPEWDAKRESLTSESRKWSTKPASDEACAARASASLVEGRLSTVEAADAERRVAVEREVGEARIAAAKLRFRADKHAAAERRAAELRRQVADIDESRCYTCGQAWSAAAAKREQLVLELDGVSAEIEDARSAAEQLADLPSPPVFTPHPFLTRLRDGLATARERVTKADAADDAERRAALVAIARQMDAAEDAATGRRTAALQAASRGAAHSAAIVRGLDIERAEASQRLSAARRLVGEYGVRSASAQRAREVCAAAKTRLAAAKRAAVAAKKRLDFEADIAALAGRNGFLGAMVQGVLAEVADTTNEILSGVANVRDVVFRFDPDPELKRISPLVVVGGAEHPLDSALSGGQGTAVRRAVDIAFGAVVAQRRGAYPGWLALDESMDGLGSSSKEAMLDVLSRFAAGRLILVIDHQSETTGLIEQVIRTETVDRRSRIV